MSRITWNAHYDGSQILLDEPVSLKPNTKLIITLLDEDRKQSEQDTEYSDFLTLSLKGFEGGFGDDEPEYLLSLLKEINPGYEAR